MEHHRIQDSRVIGQQKLCREHYRLTVQVDPFPTAIPGQFVQLGPPRYAAESYKENKSNVHHDLTAWRAAMNTPLLPRAFSIADLTRDNNHCHIDVIYRVVGAATRWMEPLSDGDSVSVLGPLGNHFPIRKDKPVAWCVAGGVGLPPILWLSSSLHRADRNTVVFCGAQTADLLALHIDHHHPPSKDASTVTPSCEEFNRYNIPVIISTDDGSLGFHGHIGAALTAHFDTSPIQADDIVVYTCGPEPMMKFVADFCMQRSIECYVCMERGMACGTGMCQSCVVPVHDKNEEQGWRYRLCCTDGPIFDAKQIIWHPVAVS